MTFDTSLSQPTSESVINLKLVPKTKNLESRHLFAPMTRHYRPDPGRISKNLLASQILITTVGFPVLAAPTVAAGSLSN